MTKPRRLRLVTETIHALSRTQLDRVVGGSDKLPTTGPHLPPTVASCDEICLSYTTLL